MLRDLYAQFNALDRAADILIEKADSAWWREKLKGRRLELYNDNDRVDAVSHARVGLSTKGPMTSCTRAW